MKLLSSCLVLIFVFVVNVSGQKISWLPDGSAYLKVSAGNIVRIDPKSGNETILTKKESLVPAGATAPLKIESFAYNNDNSKLLIYTNSAKVWRYNTRGDYWLLNLADNNLRKLGKDLPSQSLMFAKFSPDGKHVAYVSGHNIFSEDASSGVARKLTNDGSRKLINGTFDWVYEEEFGVRDGFRWSPDSRKIAFWQIDATQTRDYYMLNTTDSVYSKVIPVEYPKVGEPPSPAKIGVVTLTSGLIRWMYIEGDPQQNYLTKMEWSGTDELIVQQLDRRQQESKLIYCNAGDGVAQTFWAENDDAFVDAYQDGEYGWNWVNKGESFLWTSEKDGWRHIYKISRDGKNVTLLTKGDYDVAKMLAVDEANNYVYFTASPSNPTQRYLYRTRLNPGRALKNDPELVSPEELKGTHVYSISPNARWASHTFSNYNTPYVTEWVSLPDHKPVNSSKSIASNIKTDPDVRVEYAQVKTAGNILLDAWISKPTNFDANKKYPVVFYVYGEPGASTVDDVYGNHNNFLYAGDMGKDGYVQVSVDNRGTPVLKGRAWRKSIYKKNGDVNITDLAQGASKILELPYMDKSRVAVWGWSGGGSSTLHLLFRHPEIFQTGISIAPVTNLLYYDNIYTERYMGLPQDDMEPYKTGSAINYAKGLKGNLLLIHGTGDDNVHYSNTESLINELVKHNKQFSLMSYPNRTHNISEGPGTSAHLSTLYTNYLKQHCAPGGR